MQLYSEKSFGELWIQSHHTQCGTTDAFYTAQYYLPAGSFGRRDLKRWCLPALGIGCTVWPNDKSLPFVFPWLHEEPLSHILEQDQTSIWELIRATVLLLRNLYGYTILPSNKSQPLAQMQGSPLWMSSVISIASHFFELPHTQKRMDHWFSSSARNTAANIEEFTDFTWFCIVCLDLSHKRKTLNFSYH